MNWHIRIHWMRALIFTSHTCFWDAHGLTFLLPRVWSEFSLLYHPLQRKWGCWKAEDNVKFITLARVDANFSACHRENWTLVRPLRSLLSHANWSDVRWTTLIGLCMVQCTSNVEGHGLITCFLRELDIHAYTHVFLESICISADAVLFPCAQLSNTIFA